MIAFFIAIAARWGLTGGAAKLAGWLLAIAAAIALLGALWGAWKAFDWLNDRQAVRRDIDRTNVDVLGRQIGAERKAGAELGNAIDAAGNQQQQAEERAHAARRNRHSALDDLANGM
jgi:hypothetical protein